MLQVHGKGAQGQSSEGGTGLPPPLTHVAQGCPHVQGAGRMRGDKHARNPGIISFWHLLFLVKAQRCHGDVCWAQGAVRAPERVSTTGR